MNRFFNRLLNLKPLLLIVAFLITVIGLPLSVRLEFSNNNQWLFYFQIYPHLILFSLLGFGVVIISLYQATDLIRLNSRLIIPCLIMMAISTLLTYIEITSNNIMFLELNSKAEAKINLSQETIEKIQKIPNTIIDVNLILERNTITLTKANLGQGLTNFINKQETLTDEQKKGFHLFMKHSLSYSTWQKKENVFSLSRWFYILSFFIITTVSLIYWILLFMFTSRDVTNPKQYINLLTLGFLVFMTWVPLRYYYNLITLNLIFGSDAAIGKFNLFPFLAYPIYLLFLCRKIYQNNQDWIRISFLIIIVFLLTIIGRYFPRIISNIFDLNGNVTNWITFFIISFVYCGYQLLKIIRNYRNYSRE